jgi:Flp pilus assembly protein TadG
MSMNVVRVVRGAVKGALVAWTSTNSRRLLVRVLCDEEGSYLVLFAFLLPVLVGVTGLGTEGGLWLYTQQSLQGAADSAAVSIANLISANPSAKPADILTQAEAITVGYGFVNGAGGVTVTVNQPPKSGNYTTNPDAFEVIVSKTQNPLFSSLWLSKSFNIAARSVALAANPCGVLALDPSAPNAVSLILGGDVNLTGCPLFSDSNSDSSITVILSFGINATGYGGTVGTVGNYIDFGGPIHPTPTTGDAPITDPYLTTPLPPFTVPNPTTNAGCQFGTKLKDAKGQLAPFTATTNTPISPGVYCGGMNLSGGATVTMSPGIYILYEGALAMDNATLNGTGGVTLVFTGTGSGASAKYATLSVQDGSTVNLTAPTTGTTAGLVMYQDRNAPLGNFTFDAASGLKATGAVYLPRGKVTFGLIAGSTANCTLLVADTISFIALAGLQDQCSGVGTFSINTPGAVALVE